MTARCHCGRLSLTVPRPPDTLTDCNCSLCRRYGVLWAYYDPNEVQLPPESVTQSYSWGDGKLSFHRCITCGCVSHWYPADPERRRMGVNARLFDQQALDGIPIRPFDGAAT